MSRNESIRNAEAYHEMIDTNEQEETYACVICNYVTPLIFEGGLCGKCWKENNEKWRRFREEVSI